MPSLCLLLFAASTLNLVQHPAVASVQPVAARVHGHVTDQSGAVVIGATVVVTDAAGGVRTTKTDRQGAYAVNLLPPGTYVFVVTAAGFAEAREPLTIDAAG